MTASRSRITLIVGVLLLLALAAIAWFFLLSPRLSKAAELNQQVEQLQTANLALRNQYNKALTQAKEAPAAAAEAQTLLSTMPQQAELPQVLEQITGAAVDAGIDANAITTLTTTVPQPVVGTEAGTGAPAGVNLATMDIGVAADGSADQALRFIDNLQALDRALLVTGTDTTNVPDSEGAPSGQQAMQVSGKMFVLQSALPDLVAQVDELLKQAGTAAPAS